MTLHIDVTNRPVGSFFGNGYRSVECEHCRRPGLLLQKAPAVVAHAFTLNAAKTTSDTVCDWSDVCGKKKLRSQDDAG